MTSRTTVWDRVRRFLHTCCGFLPFELDSDCPASGHEHDLLTVSEDIFRICRFSILLLVAFGIDQFISFVYDGDRQSSGDERFFLLSSWLSFYLFYSIMARFQVANLSFLHHSVQSHGPPKVTFEISWENDDFIAVALHIISALLAQKRAK